jgi:Tol biopolymer transport system component
VREMHKLPRRTKIAGGTFLVIFLLLIISLFYIPTHSHSGRIIPFADDGNFASGGKWSPDGHWFAAAIFPSDTIQFFSPDGQVRSTWQSGCDLSGIGRNYTWLPNGWISCFTGNVPPVLQIVELDQQGPKVRTLISVPITPGTIVYDMQWNPHHFWLATIAEAKPGGGARSETLYLSDLAGHRLISPMSINGENLAWSPDGQTMAIVKEDGNIDLITVQEVEMGKLVLKKQRTLLAGTATFENIAWSPSGHWLVCRHGTYESEDYLFLLATDGSGLRVKITSSFAIGQLTSPAWSPDGKQLIVSTVFIAGNVLLSLNMVEILTEKGIKM